MVQGVPGGAAGDEPGRPPRAGKLFWRAGDGTGADPRENPGPDSLGGGDVLGREGLLPEPEHARMENLRFPHMGHDLVAIPATATWALAQHGWCDGCGLLKESHAVSISVASRSASRADTGSPSRAGAASSAPKSVVADPVTRSRTSKLAATSAGSNWRPALAHTSAYRGAAAASAARAASSPRPCRHHPGHCGAHANTLRLPASR